MFKIGFGYDSHRLIKGRLLVLGGVVIPYDKGLAGHSDADVIIHAVIDALLGATGHGDIGQHFPDTDPRYKGVSGIDLLQHTKKIIHGHRVNNIDCTLVAEAPKIEHYKTQMRNNIANVLGIQHHSVNIKAKTNEKLGLVGKDKGMAAFAVAILENKTKE